MTEAQVSATADSARDATVSVLICDDHALVAEGLSVVLNREADITVVATAGTAADSVRSAEVDVPDVVLMDYELPDATGAQATASIKSVHPTAAVVMLTSHNTDDVLAEALEAGACGFMTKDAAVSDIVGAVRRAATGEALITREMLSRLLPRLRRSERPRHWELTPRELEVLRLLSHAASNEAMAERLSISVNTVRNHVANLMAKLGAHSRLEAVATATREGLLEWEISS